MIYFYQQEEDNRTKGRVIGGVATGLYVVVLILLFLLVQFRQEIPDPAEGGLMINFGNVDEAAPGGDMALNDEIADARQQEQQTPKVESEEEQMTQDFEDAPAIKQEAKRKVEKPKTEKKTPQPKPNSQPPAEKPREVNRRALFPGRTAGSLPVTVPVRGPVIKVIWPVQLTAVSTDRVQELVAPVLETELREQEDKPVFRDVLWRGPCLVLIMGRVMKGVSSSRSPWIATVV